MTPEQSDSTDETTFQLTRRDALKTAAVVGGLSVVGLPLSTGRALAQPIETLYLSSSEPIDGGQQTRLFEVTLDAGSGWAILDELYVTTDPDFQRVDAIAASLDGRTIYMVDRDSSHLGSYDLDTTTFTDHGAIDGLPSLTVLAAFGPSGDLYVASNNTDTLYTVDYTVSPPVATVHTAISGVNVNGADIAFDANETLFLHSNANDTLYTIDYDSTSPTFGQATAVGAASGVSVTGLAVRDAGNGDLVGSSRTKDAVVVFDKTDGSVVGEFPMYIGETPYDYLNGDMTVGALDVETCDPCELEEPVKFEYDEELDTFVLEDGDEAFEAITFASYESKEGEMYEPMTATFDTEFCTVYALVKAGQEFEVQALEAEEGQVTAEYIAPYAISFVEFYCSEEAAEAAMESFPSYGKGKGRGRGE